MEDSIKIPARETGQGYWYVVAILLLTVIGCLAYLWFTEHNARMFVQARATKLAEANKSMFELVNRGAGAYVTPAAPDETSRRDATIDGQRRNVLVIDEAVGRRLGFAGGDVIFVKKARTDRQEAQGRRQ